jgi:Na+/H+ antiporter NhaC
MVSAAATSLEPVPGIDLRAHRAILPILTFLSITLLEIARRGGAFAMPLAELATLRGVTTVLNVGSGSGPLMVGSLAGLAVAVVLSLAAGMRGAILDAGLRTIRSMGIAIAILYLAWMLAEACSQVGTAQYLTVSLGDLELPMFLPIVLFVLACAISFATGTSWGTMAILLPLVVGLSYKLGSQVDIGSLAAGPETGHLLMLLSIASVLEGSIFGDHCSPISDTTVLSSVSSASDHIDHVRTQAPYALLCMVLAICAGYMPCAAYGISPWVALGSGLLVLIVALRLLGRRPEDPPERDKQLFA